MNNDIPFDDKEQLLRAVYPPEIKNYFWKKDGTLSSAALKDPNGLSVNRTFSYPVSRIIDKMRSKGLIGPVFSLTVLKCKEVSAVLQYLPTEQDCTHSEIHGSNDKKLLSDKQSKELAKSAIRIEEEY